MQYWSYNEVRQRGTRDFPVEFHHIDIHHLRYAMPYHWHMECELLRVIEGSFSLTLDHRELTVKAGDTVFINGGVLHGGVPHDCVYECIVFDMHTFIEGRTACREQLEDFLSRRMLIQEYFPASATEFHCLFDALFQTIQQQAVGYELTAIGYFYQFFGLILQSGAWHAGPSGLRGSDQRILQLKKSLELIEKQYASDLTLADLSRAAGMSPKYFCRLFRAMTHRTPIDYLNYYRAEQASFLLASTDLPITEISLECGYSDSSYFIRSFKKFKGTTPRKYRNGNHHFPSKTPNPTE